MIALLCLVITACGGSDKTDAPEEKTVSAAEQITGPEKPAEKTADDAGRTETETGPDAQGQRPYAGPSAGESASSGSSKSNADDPAHKPQQKKTSSSKSSASKKKAAKKKAEKKKDRKQSSPSEPIPKEKKKVWVEPVTETRTVELDTGTRYCCGANSNGGCGASWHGSKESTYECWHTHWQDYVKERTAEEEARGSVYVCDHIHDDSYFVPDTTTEEVIIEDGYWKEISD